MSNTDLKITIDTKEMRESLNEVEAQLDRIAQKSGKLSEMDFLISTVRINPGDTVVFSIQVRLSDDNYHRIKNAIKECLPEGTKVILLEEGLTLDSVLKANDETR